MLRASDVWSCWLCADVILVSLSAFCDAVDVVSGETGGVNSSTGTSGLSVILLGECVVTLASCGSSCVKWRCDFNISEKQFVDSRKVTNLAMVSCFHATVQFGFKGKKHIEVI